VSAPFTPLRVLVACEFSGTVRDVPGFPGYRVSDLGIVYSERRARGLTGPWRALRASMDTKRYLGLTLCGPDGERRKVRVHRLVAEVFIPNPDALPCVRHLNGDPQDNRAANLAWGTYLDNEHDKHQHGTWDARRGGAKLCAADIDLARRLHDQGERQDDIAARLGVSRPTITRLLNGSTWATTEGTSP
jgi:hypothetical protein